MQRSIKDFLFSPIGRSGRRAYLAVIASSLIAGFAFTYIEGINLFILTPLVVVFIVINTTVTIRRLHDLNLSGWLLGLISVLMIAIVLVFYASPILRIVPYNIGIIVTNVLGILFKISNFLFLLFLLLSKGENEENNYGAPVPFKGFLK